MIARFIWRSWESCSLTTQTSCTQYYCPLRFITIEYLYMYIIYYIITSTRRDVQLFYNWQARWVFCNSHPNTDYNSLRCHNNNTFFLSKTRICATLEYQFYKKRGRAYNIRLEELLAGTFCIFITFQRKDEELNLQ